VEEAFMSTEPPVDIRVTRQYQSSPERVFDAWLDPAIAGKWLFATPTGEMVRVDIDPRVGGSYTIIERRDGEDAKHSGIYSEIERPHRIVFSLSVEKNAEDADRIVVDIAPLEAGSSLTLTHELRREWAEFADRVRTGWVTVLDQLAAALGEEARP
jgi:uncharacterized protein YndB with AHSA1/START domain